MKFIRWATLGEAHKMGVDLVRLIRWAILGEVYKVGYIW
ncbi:MAG: hypothetical protein Faunusvirus42_4 [Faunusvirus sp.]|uniref:Uncharacterized protein n=1 Tax=Faunusvirus sp. TaxID=2487766 RepID=A0A3G5A2L1_9VIRU|nr:MAG: hypothetical protein Faunusvirus42_4 [Faunusvirus sp.]